MKKDKLQPPKGSRDFPPDQFAKRRWLFEQMISVSKSFGFEQYDSPVLENIETYKTKSSSELIDEQSYRFQDRGGRELTLRPEMTPVLSRIIAANENNLTFPIKWFSIPVLWRYEKPQSGRLREHFQWNVDTVGSSSALADAEVIAQMCSFLSKVGLGPDKVKVHINDRNLLNQLFASLKAEKYSGKLSKIIDRINKISENDFKSQVEYETKIKGLGGKLITLLNNPHSLELNENIVQVIKYLEELGHKDYIQLNPKIVRGLDYYTSTVFEVFPTTNTSSRAVAGGGRYDNLVGQFSSRRLPGVGFGMGDVVIGNLLEKYDLYPPSLQEQANTLIAPLSDNGVSQSLRLSTRLRKKNLTVSVFPGVEKIQTVINYSLKNNFRYLILIGEKELSSHTYTVKDLKANLQSTVLYKDLLKRLKAKK